MKFVLPRCSPINVRQDKYSLFIWIWSLGYLVAYEFDNGFSVWAGFL